MPRYYDVLKNILQYFSGTISILQFSSTHNGKLSLHDIRIENADCACFMLYYECSHDRLEIETKRLYSALDKMDDIDLGDIIDAVLSTFQQSTQGELCILSDVDKMDFALDGCATYPTSPKVRPFFYNTTKLKRMEMWRAAMHRKIKFVNNFKPYQLRVFFECFCKPHGSGVYHIDSGRFDYTHSEQGIGYLST
jgi:hypothetical protein